jgi:hypothetical protein
MQMPVRIDFQGMRGTPMLRASIEQHVMLRFSVCIAIPVLWATQVAFGTDLDAGRRLAETRCVPCHIVGLDRTRVVADAPPFEVIAGKFRLAPELLAYLLLHPHPRMNVPLTRAEAADIAAYLGSLAK